MKAITLPKTVVKTIVPAQTVSVSELTITRIVDLPTEKVVRAFTKEMPGPITLWEGAAYDAVGQWTDVQVEERILELFK